MKWIVVKFVTSGGIEEIEVVPYNWLKSQDMCWWPPFKKTALEKSIRSCIEPDETIWEICQCKVMSKIYDKFSLASTLASKGQYYSDIDVESTGSLPDKRVVKRSPRFIYSDSEDEQINEDDGDIDIPKLPKFPDTGLSLKPIQPNRFYHGNQKLQDKMDMHLNESNGASCSRRNMGSDLDVNRNHDARSHRQEYENISEIRYPSMTNDEVSSGAAIENITLHKIVELLIKNNNLLKSVSRDLENMNHKIENLKMASINGLISPSDPITNEKIQEIFDKLPVTERNIIPEIDTKLGKKDIQKAVALKLSHIGGDNYKEAVRRIMSKILHNDVIKLFSWKGHKGKQIFSKLNMAKIVIEAVELVDQSATEKHIEEAVAIWLAKASERIKRNHF